MKKSELIEELEALKWAIVEDGLIPTLDEAIERVKQADSDEDDEYDGSEDQESEDEPYDHYQETYEVTNRE